jgi:small subunit ribosomal protein S8
MSLSDPISDMLARIKNAQGRKHTKVVCRSSRMNKDILEVLKSQGFIESFEEKPVREGVSEISVTLKYHQGHPSIKMLKRVSRPGRRVYSSFSELKPVYNGLGLSVLSTSKGVITDADARSLRVGGEVLFQIY